MSHGSFFWYDLVSKDTRASRAFLTRLFGWVASDAAMPDGTPYTSFSSGGNVICGLMPLNETRDYEGGKAYWMTYIQVDRLFSTITRAERQGGEVLSEVMPVPDLGSYQVLRSPDGGLLALVEARQPVLSPGFSWNTITWNELMSPQPQRAQDFYRAIAGWSHQDVTGTLNYAFFTLGGANVAGLLDMSTPDFTALKPGWQTYIAVEDVDALTAQVPSCGGHIAAEPFDLPGVGRVAVIIEPGEGVISLLTPPA